MAGREMMIYEYSLSVVFCVMDETESLTQTFLYFNQLGDVKEILFVLSHEGTEESILNVKTICRQKNCRYIFQSEKGLGNAIRDAISVVNGTHMLVWAADGGMDTHSVPQMLALSKASPEKIVKISRWIPGGGFERTGKFRKCINYVSQRAFAVLYRSGLTDFTNPTQISPVALYRKIAWEGTGFEFIPEMIFKPLRLGCEFIEVPCRDLGRQEGSSHSSVAQFIRYYGVILKIRFSLKRTLLLEGKQ